MTTYNAEKSDTSSTSDNRRRFLLRATAAVGGACLGLNSRQALSSETWPLKPVRIVVPLGPGSASDIHARLVAEELQTVYKQPFVVENKAGASGILGAEFVARSAPDGYTLLLATNTVSSINPFLFKRLPYHPIKDFTPIARLSAMPFVFLVRAELPVRNIAELIAYAKTSKQHVSYGYANATGQVAGATLIAKTGLDCVSIPYKGTPAAMTDLLAGQITFMTGDLASARSFIDSNKVRPIAVLTQRRSSLIPTLPSVAESIGAPDFDLQTWLGVLGPANLPPAIVQSLNARINAFLSRKETIDRLVSIGAEMASTTPQELGTYMQQQLDVSREKVREAGIKPE